MSLYTAAHFNGESVPCVLVHPSLAEDVSEAYSTMENILKERWKAEHPGKAIGAAVVFVCHEGIPDPSLNLTEEEKQTYFPTPPQSSVRILGSH